MDELSFLKGLGFKSNPFLHTNADEEDNLNEYFVPPPYFQSVWGDPAKASSCVIFAPKGGGKSAQRRIIEFRAMEKESRVLALQYSRFEFASRQKVDDISLGYHLKNIIRLCLLGLLMKIYEKELDHSNFSAIDKMHIKDLCKYYLANMNKEEVIHAVDALKSRLDKAKEWFKSKFWVINTIISIILKQIGSDATSGVIQTEGITAGKIEKPSKIHLEILGELTSKIGYDSIYILIDKVDETSLTTNDSEASYKLIEPMIRDLELLQLKRFGFKFFLWNEIEPLYRKYARPDRIPQYQLKWNRTQLALMLKLRLQAFRANGASTFNDLFDFSIEKKAKEAIENLVYVFSLGSPRDMIRICRQMVTEQLRINPEATRIDLPAVTSAFTIFCNDRAREVVSEQVLHELKKTRRLDFTVNYIANEIFKISTNGARAKIKVWLSTGVVKHIDDIFIPGSKKPVHHYALVDSRVAKSIFPEMLFTDFLGNKIRLCKNCGVELLRDWDISENQECHECKVPYKK